MNFFKRNLVIKIMSLVSAVLLWFYVTNVQAPTEIATRTIKLEVRQLASGFSLVNSPDTVIVRVQGTKNALSNLNNKEITAYVDLYNAKAGDNEVPVQVKLPTGVRMLGAIPERVTISIDAIEKKEVPVKVKITGKPANGYLIGEPKVNPGFVTVKGPGRFLRQIYEVYLDLDVDGAQQNLNLSRPVRVGGKNIDPSTIEIDPSDVQVILPINKDTQTKTLPLKYTLTGSTDPGFQVDNVAMSIDKLTLLGAKELLDPLTVINLDPIDITGAKADIIKDVRVILPEGVTSQSGATVTVTVKVVAKPGGKANQ